MSEEYSNGYARGYEAGQQSVLKLAEQPAQQEQESWEDLHNALQRIDTAAVGLPTFEVRHEGGLDAVTQNIVDAITALHTQPAQQEPVNEGWKLVPVEPTEDMWKAVNKLDDEMAAGSYDGKGCSIEQAWNCLLDAAPTPPAQRTWVGLTEDEIYMNCPNWLSQEQCKVWIQQIEAKLKEKNT